MASNHILKKSVLGGFRKEDVINYVEGLQAEIHRLKKDLSAKNDALEKLESNKTVAEALEGDVAVLKAEIETLKAENAALKSENDNHLAANCSDKGQIDILKAELDEAKARAAALESENDNSRAALIELECIKVEKERLGEELEKTKSAYDEKISVYQEKIASIEAMVASLEAACVSIDESKDAKAKAEAVNEAVAKALEQVTEANDRIRTACVDYDSSAVMLKSSVENLLNVLNSL